MLKNTLAITLSGTLIQVHLKQKKISCACKSIGIHQTLQSDFKSKLNLYVHPTSYRKCVFSQTRPKTYLFKKKLFEMHLYFV